MSNARENCIWYGQCDPESCEGCQDYSPADESEDSEKFYQGILEENARVYDKIIREFSGRGDHFES